MATSACHRIAVWLRWEGTSTRCQVQLLLMQGYSEQAAMSRWTLQISKPFGCSVFIPFSNAGEGEACDCADESTAAWSQAIRTRSLLPLHRFIQLISDCLSVLLFLLHLQLVVLSFPQTFHSFPFLYVLLVPWCKVMAVLAIVSTSAGSPWGGHQSIQW